MSVFKGAGVAIVTPMYDNEEVNYDKLGELLEEQIARGTDAIIICGTTGEASTLTHEEHLAVIKYAVEKVNHRVPVIAGTGSNATDTAIYLSTEAEKYGADALLLVTPYYTKATQKGLKLHFSKIAESVKLPIIMYNVPSRTGCNIQPATAVEIAKRNPNVVAIKDAVGDLSVTATMVYLSGQEGNCMDIYSGNDDQIVPIMSVGGLGVISVLSNVMPKETHEMAMACIEGNYEKAREMQLKMLPLIHALFCEVNPIPVKTAMNLMGMNVGPLRRPMSPMEEANVERLKKAMKDLGLIQ